MHLRPSAPGQARIIVLEQDRPILTRLCDLLGSKGYLTIGLDNAPTACKMLRRGCVDLVLTTIALPEPDRSAWSSALGRLDVKVPVIAMCEASTARALDLFDTANEFGATAMLRRPFAAATLLQMISDLLPSLQPREAASAEPQSVRADWLSLVSGSLAIH